jgi:hypothetical protein
VKSLDFRRYALCSFVAAAMLAGCGGSQPPIGAPGTMPQTSAIATHADRGKSWMLPEASGEDLLYVTDEDANSVFVYSYPAGQLDGTLTFSHPVGECVDASGDVFIADGQSSVAEYAHGGTTQIGSLQLPDKYYPSPHAFGCAVDPRTGHIAVLFQKNGPYASQIAVFRSVTDTNPTIYSQLRDDFAFCGYDNAGNLFLDGWIVHSHLWELKRGGKSVTLLHLRPYQFTVGQIQWDGQYITVRNSQTGDIHRIRVSGSRAIVVSGTRFRHVYKGGLSWIQGDEVMIPIGFAGRQKISIRPYPAGGRGSAIVAGPLELVSGLLVSPAQ